MKFSIIVPVYNVEKYINRCLDSIVNQSYKKFEVIIINDGSTDSSEDIIKSYNDSRIKYFKQENMGLSEARNNGVLKARGDYLLFVDSDDYLNIDLLKVLNDNLDKDYDLIRFQVDYDINGNRKNTKGTKNDIIFSNGIDAFNEISSYEIVEGAWCYLYNRNFFIKNNFKFSKGRIHEDFGLVPLIILKANNVKCINYVGYNYVIRDNSIMTNNDYEKILKKADDFLFHFKYLLDESRNIKGDLSIFKSFIANSIILKSTTLNGKDYHKYLEELKKINTFDMLLSDTLARKIKKIIIKISPKLYYKFLGGNK